MALLRIGDLPGEAVAAAMRFHAEDMPGALAVLDGGEELTLVFAPADHTHRGWRLAAVQALARRYAPLRVNALAGDDAGAIAAAQAYLASAPGITGQLLILDGNGAGAVLSLIE